MKNLQLGLPICIMALTPEYPAEKICSLLHMISCLVKPRCKVSRLFVVVLVRNLYSMFLELKISRVSRAPCNIISDCIKTQSKSRRKPFAPFILRSFIIKPSNYIMDECKHQYRV